MPWVKRLGYLLEIGGAGNKTAGLAAYVAEHAHDYALLSPGTRKSSAPRNKAWKLIINTDVEFDL